MTQCHQVRIWGDIRRSLRHGASWRCAGTTSSSKSGWGGAEEKRESESQSEKGGGERTPEAKCRRRMSHRVRLPLTYQCCYSRLDII